MTALVLVILNVFDAWLMRMHLGMDAVELNPLAHPFIANLAARGLMAIALILILYMVRKENLLWGANLITFGLLSWHLIVQGLSTLNLPLS